jgi:predicted enzyme related to lactoylglutathione lyase
MSIEVEDRESPMEDRVFRSSILHLLFQLIKTSCCKSQKEVAMKVLRMRSWNFHADNLDQMTRFYQNALGAEVRTQHTVGGVNVTRLRAGETGLGLFNAAEKRAPGVPHHTFDIEGPSDPKELINELEAKGIKVDDLRLHGEGPGYSVYVIDPSGNRLELSKD